MKYSLASAALFASQALAYPFVLDEVKDSEAHQSKLTKRVAGPKGLPNPLPASGSDAAIALSKSRGNCGLIPCLVFNAAEQYVSTSGTHAWKAPGSSDIRGTCPGLNAAANHGYLPRSGVAHILDTVQGLGAAYGMSVDLAAFLAAYAVIFNGDPLTLSWSIGGPPPANPLSGILTGAAQGIDFSHSNYEGDVSIGRPDAYLNNGDAYTLDMNRYRSAYEATESADRYTLDSFAQNFDAKMTQSINDNPYFFSGPFAGLVAPAAYNFVINFMSNRTADNVNGYLDGNLFKQFFSISGDYPDFTWTPGHERIPDNWYRRTSENQYNAANVFTDLIPQFLAYPNSFRIGGNTGTTNSYVGFDFSDLTGGLLDNIDTLFEGDNFQCFLSSAALAVVPDALEGGLLGAVTNIVTQFIDPITADVTCPPGLELNKEASGKFPGASYNPQPPKSKRATIFH